MRASSPTPVRRIRLVVAAVVLLTLVGGSSSAAAHWSATAQVQTEASAATVGLTQTVQPGAETAVSPLVTTYSTTNLVAAGAVSIQNTGSREAAYTLSILSTASTVAGLPGAIEVAVAPVANVAACTPETVLVAPTTGVFSTTTPFESGGEVAAGAAVVLCVQTSMALPDVIEYQSQSTQLALHSELEYAEAAAWILSSATVDFTQSVASTLLFYTDDSARYNILNDDICIRRHNSPPPLYPLARNETCGDGWEAQWRISHTDDGTFYISWAYNDPDVPVAPRWTAVSTNPADTVLNQDASDSPAQRWIISGVSGAEYRIESVAHPGHCLTIGGPLWGGTNPLKLVLDECEDLSTQLFTFEMIGDPLHEAEEMSCANAPWSTTLSFSQNSGYQGETVYRAFLARESTPDARVSYPIGALQGWYTVLTLQADGAGLVDFVNSAEGSTGNTWVYVEQQVGNSGTWSLAAVGQVRLYQDGSNLFAGCDWQ